MNFLESLTPAENYLILNPKASLKMLLKLTMFDLLLKEVLKTKGKVVKSDPRSPERILTFVQRGRSYQYYKPKNHELIFLTVFKDHDTLEILFKHWVKKAYDMALTKRHYLSDHLFCDREVANMFRLSRVFGKIDLTPHGRRTQQHINHELARVKTLITDDPNMVSKIKGNLFLIIDPVALAEGGSEVPETWQYYSNNAHLFDQAFDSAVAYSGGRWFGNWGSDTLTG